MGKLVVAEGVETWDQFDLLSSYECDQVQGYLLSKPVGSVAIQDLFLQSNLLQKDTAQIIPLHSQDQA